MFQVLFLICSIEAGSVTSNCVEISDTWGPYRTEENCYIRLNQMIDTVHENDVFNEYVFSRLGFPDNVIPIIAQCTEVPGIDA